jgi:hypothetical protein
MIQPSEVLIAFIFPQDAENVLVNACKILVVLL